MKLLAWICFILFIFPSQFVCASATIIPECDKIKPYICNAATGCEFWMNRYVGKCISLINLEKDHRYTCHISGIVTFKGIDAEHASELNMDVFSIGSKSFSVGTARISTPTADVLFNIESDFQPSTVDVNCLKN